MSTTAEKINIVLTNALKPEILIVTDDSDEHIGHAGAQTGKGHFTIEISSPLFANKNRLTCHRMIYQALAELMQTEIHALQITITDK